MLTHREHWNMTSQHDKQTRYFVLKDISLSWNSSIFGSGSTVRCMSKLKLFEIDYITQHIAHGEVCAVQHV